MSDHGSRESLLSQENNGDARRNNNPFNPADYDYGLAVQTRASIQLAQDLLNEVPENYTRRYLRQVEQETDTIMFIRNRIGDLDQDTAQMVTDLLGQLRLRERQVDRALSGVNPSQQIASSNGSPPASNAQQNVSGSSVNNPTANVGQPSGLGLVQSAPPPQQLPPPSFVSFATQRSFVLILGSSSSKHPAAFVFFVTATPSAAVRVAECAIVRASRRRFPASRHAATDAGTAAVLHSLPNQCAPTAVWTDGAAVDHSAHSLLSQDREFEQY